MSLKPVHQYLPAELRPALRLVSTTDLSREEWLVVRKQGIGSSDAAAAVGLNPYKSQLELWLEKTGRDSDMPAIDPSDDRHPTYWGTLLEPYVARAYSNRTGNRVRRINAVLCHPDPALHFMLANIDREVMGCADVQILECKTAGINGARLWKDGVPEYVVLQVQHQLAVTGKQAADVAVLLAGQELQVHRINRDDELIKRLIALEAEFWQYVLCDMPPPADGSESANQALRCLYPNDDGQTVDFREDMALSATFDDWVAVRETISSYEVTEAKLKQTLQQAMGEASKALFDTGAVTFKRSKDGVSFDAARFLKEQPDIAKSYLGTKPGSRRFCLV